MLNRSVWKLLVLWVLAPAVVGTLSLAVPVTIISGLPSSFFVGDNGLAPLFICAFCLVVITAPMIGLAQAKILKHLLNTAKDGLIGRWVLVTLVGILLAIVAVGVVNASLLCGGGIILPGTVLGYAQLLVLRVHVQNAGWWVLACGLAWNASFLVCWAMSSVYLSVSDLSALPYIPVRTLLYSGVITFTGMLIFGIITGITLMGLLTRNNVGTQMSKGQ